MFVAVQKAVREALAAHSPVPSFGTRGAEGWKLPDTERDACAARRGAGAGAGLVAGPPAARPTARLPCEPHGKASSSAATPRRRSPGVAAGFGRAGADRPALAAALLPHAAPTAPALPAAGAIATRRRRRPLPPLRVVGQVSNTYIITEGPDGMFLIDQHAAHERVLYERFDREVRAGGACRCSRSCSR